VNARRNPCPSLATTEAALRFHLDVVHPGVRGEQPGPPGLLGSVLAVVLERLDRGDAVESAVLAEGEQLPRARCKGPKFLRHVSDTPGLSPCPPTLFRSDWPISPDGSYPAPHIQQSPFASTHAPYFSAIAKSRYGVAPRWTSGVGRFTTAMLGSGKRVR
jgi:hypothetical protein